MSEGIDDLLTVTARRAEAALEPARLARFGATLDGPLAVVGSGGSLSTALLWAHLHEARRGAPAWALTPYQLVERGVPPSTRVLLLSAGGAHHDILRAARHGAARSWALRAVTCRAGSPLAEVVGAACGPDAVLALPEPLGDDGVLAIHGLAPVALLAARLHEEPAGAGGWTACFAGATPLTLPAQLRRPRFVVALGAGVATAAAADFAGRSQESGLAPAWHTDPRNFAHAQFLALADGPPGEALVVSFALAHERPFLDRWLATLPPETPRLRIEPSSEGATGARAGLELLLRGVRTFEALGRATGAHFDLAELPAWGRALYFLEV